MDQQFSKAMEKSLRAWQSFAVDKLLMRSVNFAEEGLLVHSWAQKMMNMKRSPVPYVAHV